MYHRTEKVSDQGGWSLYSVRRCRGTNTTSWDCASATGGSELHFLTSQSHWPNSRKKSGPVVPSGRCRFLVIECDAVYGTSPMIFAAGWAVHSQHRCLQRGIGVVLYRTAGREKWLITSSRAKKNFRVTRPHLLVLWRHKKTSTNTFMERVPRVHRQLRPDQYGVRNLEGQRRPARCIVCSTTCRPNIARSGTTPTQMHYLDDHVEGTAPTAR
jgi:hypothetical protein